MMLLLLSRTLSEDSIEMFTLRSCHVLQSPTKKLSAMEHVHGLLGNHECATDRTCAGRLLCASEELSCASPESQLHDA